MQDKISFGSKPGSLEPREFRRLAFKLSNHVPHLPSVLRRLEVPRRFQGLVSPTFAPLLLESQSSPAVAFVSHIFLFAASNNEASSKSPRLFACKVDNASSCDT